MEVEVGVGNPCIPEVIDDAIHVLSIPRVGIETDGAGAAVIGLAASRVRLNRELARVKISQIGG